MQTTETNAHHPLTILVVDDNRDICDLLHVLLEGHGYRVVEVTDGRKALEAVLREHPVLIFMDLYMPNQDGFVTARLIRRHTELAEIPIIAISAYGALGIDSELQREALAAGFNEYITKPIDTKHLESLIQQFIPAP
jgi:CheY-like chemotaxis protein